MLEDVSTNEAEERSGGRPRRRPADLCELIRLFSVVAFVGIGMAMTVVQLLRCLR